MNDQANPAPPPAKKTNVLFIVLIVVGVGGLLVVAAIGILATLAIYGSRSYLQKAKSAEAMTVATGIARGVVACSERE